MEEEVFIARYGLGQPSGKRDLSVYELSWVTGADIFVILEALKQLKRADLISVKVKYALHWCSGRWHNG